MFQVVAVGLPGSQSEDEKTWPGWCSGRACGHVHLQGCTDGAPLFTKPSSRCRPSRSIGARRQTRNHTCQTLRPRDHLFDSPRFKLDAYLAFRSMSTPVRFDANLPLASAAALTCMGTMTSSELHAPLASQPVLGGCPFPCQG